uniref:26S proteasome non-ATPase regulatory subunit 13 n=1 Tax=Panagrellus redivivus TaxID=6233 RepID=A0A7E4VK51_PANRE
MSDKVEVYLKKLKEAVKTPAIVEAIHTLENLYTKKLWHQLTTELRKDVYNPAFAQHVDLKDFYDQFIVELERHINLLNLAEIVIPVSKAIFAKNKDAAFEFLAGIQKTVKKDKQALIRVNSGIIELHLNNKTPAGGCVDIKLIRSLIEEAQHDIDELTGVTPVHAPFYKVSANYLKEVGNFAGYYRESLRYLGCEDAQKLSTEEKHVQAMLLGFAALLGENIYNFGELLAHPILDALKGTAEHWLVDVLYSFNSGDLTKFREYEPKWSPWSDMRKRRDFLEEKIRLLCIMEVALGRNSKERHISFNEIASKALIDQKNVEFLVMKALSKGLVKGSIDQVNRIVNITWVQPRVLSPAQIYQMSERIGAWRADVEAMESVVRDNAKEILMKV